MEVEMDVLSRSGKKADAETSRFDSDAPLKRRSRKEMVLGKLPRMVHTGLTYRRHTVENGPPKEAAQAGPAQVTACEHTPKLSSFSFPIQVKIRRMCSIIDRYPQLRSSYHKQSQQTRQNLMPVRSMIGIMMALSADLELMEPRAVTLRDAKGLIVENSTHALGTSEYPAECVLIDWSRTCTIEKLARAKLGSELLKGYNLLEIEYFSQQWYGTVAADRAVTGFRLLNCSSHAETIQATCSTEIEASRSTTSDREETAV